jgi:hypothetical protein
MPLAFIELFVVLAFVAAWGVLELVARRLDVRRDKSGQGDPPKSSGSAATGVGRIREIDDNERL